MSTSIRERRERSAAALSERAVELRREDEEAPQRLASMERWRRKSDEPARVHHANGILALRCWIEACGYDMEKSYNVLSVSVAAAGGADFEVSRPDWMMGFYLRGGTPEEFARVAPLPGKGSEKRALAKAWTDAFAVFQAEQERVGVYSARRRHGERRNGKNVSSKLHVYVAQDLAEIERSPERRGRKRFEGFAAAARAQLEIVRRDPERFVQRTPTSDPSPRPGVQEAAPPNRRAAFIAKLSKLTRDVLKAEIAAGATEAELDELRAAAHSHLEELFADALPPSCCTTSLEKSSTTNPTPSDPVSGKSARTLFSATPQILPENDEKIEFGVTKSVTPNVPQPLPDETEVREKIAMLVEAGELDEENARGFEELVHDPETRRAFARRYMRVSR
ncbi:MAG TPA: hypothetical protein VF297_32445 [Pyrinomonadaceae bacterium]